MRQGLKITLFILVISVMWGMPALAQKTIIAVAANFTAPAKEIAAAFEKKTGRVVVLSFGSTGKLYAQIIHGAPFSVLLAADRERPELLEEASLGTSRFTYAQGRLALMGSKQVLEDGSFKRLSVANPKTAPYGVAAQQVLEKMGLYETVRSKLVYGENIAQAYQFFATGNAELGLVAASNTQGKGWLVPAHMHAPLDQQAILLKRGLKDKTAIAFLAFLKSKEATSILINYGYSIAKE